MSTALTSHGLGRLAADHPRVVQIGRAGWFAKGVVYLVAGALAFFIAAQSSGWSGGSSVGSPDGSPASDSEAEASPTGALTTIAHLSGGAVLMWLLALGMLIYAAWRLLSALLPGGTDAKAWITRIGYVVSAVVYITFAFTAISLALAPPTDPDGNEKVTSISGTIMDHTGGRLLIGLVGLIVIGAGIYRFVKGVKVDVSSELDLSGMSPRRLRWTKRLGAIGEVGRGVGIGLVGFFLLRAALTYEKSQATGLDGALRRLATESWGLVVVLVVATGFAAYGIFCLATFTRRRLEAPS